MAWASNLGDWQVTLIQVNNAMGATEELEYMSDKVLSEIGQNLTNDLLDKQVQDKPSTGYCPAHPGNVDPRSRQYSDIGNPVWINSYDSSAMSGNI